MGLGLGLKRSLLVNCPCFHVKESTLHRAGRSGSGVGGFTFGAVVLVAGE
jgi:hypothetical protein